MYRSHYLALMSLGLLSILVALAALAAQVAAQNRTTQATLTVVTTGLNNPRGLTFAPDGTLYVAEAGGGGTGPCIPGPGGVQVCYGPTGAITRVFTNTHERIITGLPSLAGPGGISATGPHDIALFRDGTGFIVTGLGAAPTRRSQLGAAGGNFGQLVRITTQLTGSQQTTNVFDVAGYEQTADPDRVGADSNPYALVALPDRRLVVDAGGNDLLILDNSNTVITATVFPTRTVPAPFFAAGLAQQIPMQPVPNTVAIGPDAAYYVGELTGFPFPVGGARVYRVVPGQPPTIYAQGFTNIIDMVFDSAGNLYVLEIAEKGLLQAESPGGDFTGALLRVTPQLSQTTVITEGLTAPTSLALSPSGGIYIANNGIFSGTGQIVRVNICAPNDDACTEPQPLPVPFVATLTGEAEVDNNGTPGQGDPDGRGSAIFTLDALAGQVCVQSSVANIVPPNGAHIHRGAAGTNGPVVVDFTNLISGTLISGCTEADQDIITAIQDNPSGFYFNVHNDDFPAGAVRGQLVRGDESPAATSSSRLFLPQVRK